MNVEQIDCLGGTRSERHRFRWNREDVHFLLHFIFHTMQVSMKCEINAEMCFFEKYRDWHFSPVVTVHVVHFQCAESTLGVENASP